MYYSGSDHFPNFLIVTNFLQAFKQRNTNTFYRRHIDRIDVDKLNQDFNDLNWENLVLNESNIDKCFDNIIDHCKDLLESHAPLKEISRRKSKYLFKPWIDSEILSEIRLKNSFYKNKNKLNSDLNNDTYKMQKNKVTKLLRTKKKQYLDDYLKKYRNGRELI